MSFRHLRGLLPLLKKVGETESSLLDRTRDQILKAADVKFRFVNGFHLMALGPPLDDDASGVVVALIGFSRSVFTDQLERLMAHYRGKISLKEKTKSELNLEDFIKTFSSSYCGRNLLLNPGHQRPSTMEPPRSFVDVHMQRLKPYRPTTLSRLKSLRIREIKNDQLELDADCWLNFEFPSIVKLMKEKSEQEFDLISYHRSRLGPWSDEQCLDVSKEPPSMDTFLRLFREAKVLHGNVLEKCLNYDAWLELRDSRVITRY